MATAHSYDDVKKLAESMSDEDKLRLADELLQDLRAPDPAIQAVWLKEVEARRAAYRAGKLDAMDAEDFMRELRST